MGQSHFATIATFALNLPLKRHKSLCVLVAEGTKLKKNGRTYFSGGSSFVFPRFSSPNLDDLFHVGISFC